MNDRRILLTKEDVILYGAVEIDANSIGTEVKGLFVPINLFYDSSTSASNTNPQLLLSISVMPPSSYDGAVITYIYPSWNSTNGESASGKYTAIVYSSNSTFSVQVGTYYSSFSNKGGRTINFASTGLSAGNANFKVAANPDNENTFYIYIDLKNSFPFSTSTRCNARMSWQDAMYTTIISSSNLKYTIYSYSGDFLNGYPIYYIPA